MHWKTTVLALVLAGSLASCLQADNELADNELMVARWDFPAEESSLLRLHGNVQRDQAGPSPPEYPDFSENNTAVRLDGKGSYLSTSELGDLPKGRVLVQFCEGLVSHERWLNEGEDWPAEKLRWIGDEFLLPRIPLRYDDWGIRASWKAPLLVRMAADVELPPGSQRLLLRTRALSRLWVDGIVVARTSAISKKSPDGEEPITPLAEPSLTGMRIPGYHQQEVFGDFTIAETPNGQPREVRIVLEMIVGGENLRTETGEVCVARLDESGQSYLVLQPPGDRALLLTDSEVEPALARIESSLSAGDDRRRRNAAASQDDFWQMRHDVARQWSEAHPAPAIPNLADATLNHPMDAFIAAKIENALTAASKSDARQAQQFHTEVLPILREHCFRCHGEKEKGGLKLNARELAVRGGDSEVPAVVPGDASASELMLRVREEDESLRMPPTGDSLSAEQIAVLEKWVDTGAAWPALPISDDEVAYAPVISDETFLRRVYLDTVGVPPTSEAAKEFLADGSSDKREALIDQLLSDQRCADHWISYWLDLLAENPTLINASLNSTGPFRWFLVDSLRDNKPLDRLVTELILMRGSPYEGGSAGFALAAENDSPYAEKGHILASAFLGIELQCARCHDSPYHSTMQRDLYSVAAMLERKSVSVPKTSRVPATFFEEQARESLIRVTLKPDELVTAEWPFAECTGIEDCAEIDQLMYEPSDSRERLAVLITAPANLRFSRVIVNRIWKQLIGAGLVEPIHDWEGRLPSHPELLDWLSEELITNDYDAKHIQRLILTSRTYQREATGRNLEQSPEQRFFRAPERRRLSAEQIVDSLHAATSTPMNVEELTFVHDGRRAIGKRLTLGQPRRAWMLASLNNERDRPSLSLPRARSVADTMKAFGWTGSRQQPIAGRDTEPNVLQPGTLANGTLSMTLARASYGSELANLAVDAESPVSLVDELFLRFFSRRPTPNEQVIISKALKKDFDTRLVATDEIRTPVKLPPLPQVTWFNHLRPDANTIQQEVERRVRLGPPYDPRLRLRWREVYEDVVWSLINYREFVWMP